MYAIIHKNKVISGPRDWNRGFFSVILKRKNITDAFIPKKPTEDILPYIIDENTRIVKAEVQQDEFDPRVEFLHGPHWTINTDSAVAEYRVTLSPMSAIKANFKNIAADERYKREMKGTNITIQGTEVTLNTTRGERDIFIQKYLLMNDNDTVNWKFPETWLLLTKSDLGYIVQTGASYIQSCFDWEKLINDQIDSAQDVSEILAIDITTSPEENNE